MQEKIIENIKKIIYYAIPLGLIIIYISTAFNNCIWLDEAFSMSMIQQNFGEIIYNTAIDVHPPLYYIILKVLVNILGFISIDVTGTSASINFIISDGFPVVLLISCNI